MFKTSASYDAKLEWRSNGVNLNNGSTMMTTQLKTGQVRYHNELMTAAAAALKATDGDAFDALLSINEGWLQTDEESDAMRRLLNAMQEAAFLLEDCCCR